MEALLKVKKRVSVEHFIKEYVLDGSESYLCKFPKLITLDAYNTIYATEKPVIDLYAETYNKDFGVNQKIGKEDRELMFKKFPVVFKTHMNKYPNYGKHAHLPAADWWCLLIQAAFKEANISLKKNEALKILKPFEGEVYRSFPDLSHLLRTVRKISNTKIGICSNTDPLFHDVMAYLKATNDQFVVPDGKFVYLSYDLDTKKNKTGEFLKLALAAAKKEIANLTADDCWHIGDELENDLLGSVAAGWTGICIDRGDSYGYFSQGEEKPVSSATLTLNKINKSATLLYNEGKHCNDIVLLQNGGLVVRNLFVVEKLLLAIQRKEA